MMAQILASKLPGNGPVGLPGGGAPPQTGGQLQGGKPQSPEECLELLSGLVDDPQVQDLITALQQRLEQLGVMGAADDDQELPPEEDPGDHEFR